MNGIFQAIAQKEHTTENSVIREIELAVACAQKNAPHMWANYHGTTAYDAVTYLTQKVLLSIAQ